MRLFSVHMQPVAVFVVHCLLIFGLEHRHEHEGGQGRDTQYAEDHSGVEPGLCVGFRCFLGECRCSKCQQEHADQKADPVFRWFVFRFHNRINLEMFEILTDSTADKGRSFHHLVSGCFCPISGQSIWYSRLKAEQVTDLQVQHFEPGCIDLRYFMLVNIVGSYIYKLHIQIFRVAAARCRG
jgi:hypothetical protein